MASSRPDADPRGGYATVAAMGVSLAIGLLAGALVLHGVASLKLARSDLRRAQAEYALSGAQVLAATRLLGGSGDGRLAWSAGGLDGEDVTLLAEPESGKLKLTAVADLDDKVLAELGASDPGMARLRVAALDPTSAQPDQVEGADPAAAWRACAASAISPWGAAETVRLGAAQAPNDEPGGARAGQVWRVRAVTADGWTDERIVRLTSVGRGPGAMIWRRFGRGARATCDKTIGS